MKPSLKKMAGFGGRAIVESVCYNRRFENQNARRGATRPFVFCSTDTNTDTTIHFPVFRRKAFQVLRDPFPYLVTVFGSRKISNTISTSFGPVKGAALKGFFLGICRPSRAVIILSTILTAKQSVSSYYAPHCLNECTLCPCALRAVIKSFTFEVSTQEHRHGGVNV